MVRIERSAGGLVLASRLARPRVLAVLAAAFILGAAGLRGAAPRAALGLAAVAALVVLLGGRSVRATFARGRVRVSGAPPLRRQDRGLAEFTGVQIETVGEARARRAERLAHGYRERSGSAAPSWLVPAPAPGTNDHLRRLVLLAREGEPLPVTTWLAPEDDLEPARAEVAALFI
ncbi:MULTISPECIES: hypothetical protein [unclassified Anaeromyxobacter]|uniref:hypothetical protein n=1 Tax=unclassified Anaeromyxobacter TaxID=2620896 RepID=UPI001F588AB0|nr:MULTISPECIES: hypothetical protein [unclassified Anaeromyxobacter]